MSRATTPRYNQVARRSEAWLWLQLRLFAGPRQTTRADIARAMNWTDGAARAWIIALERDGLISRDRSMMTLRVSELAQAVEQCRPAMESAAGTSFMYCLASDGIGLVKIGHSINPERRMEELQRQSPDVLRLVITVPGGQRVEAAAHRAFDEHRRHGEWFDVHPDDVVRWLKDCGHA